MASNELIDRYLTDLRQRVGSWHRRPDEVVDEAADHLIERAAELVRSGIDPEEASRRAIGEYGTAGEVADAHLRAARRPAIPTADTRSLGTIALMGGVGWMLLPVLTTTLPDVQPIWLALASLLHLTVAASALACVGLWKRLGGLGPLGYAAALPALAATPFVLFAWPIPVWTVLLGTSTLLFGLAVLSRRTAPRTASVGLTFGLAVSAGAVLGAELVVGQHDDDFAFLSSTAAGALMIIGMIVFGVSLLGLGRWLRSEDPVEIPPLPAPSAPA